MTLGNLITQARLERRKKLRDTLEQLRNKQDERAKERQEQIEAELRILECG